MNIRRTDLEKFAQSIVNEIKNNFALRHLSGNLADTIEIVATADSVQIIIPAEIYDIDKFKETGAIIPTGEGSYAAEVDVTGGFSGTHKGYIEKSIMLALLKWYKLDMGASGYDIKFID